MAAVSPFLNASNILNSLTDDSIDCPCAALAGVAGVVIAVERAGELGSVGTVFDMMVVRCGRWVWVDARLDAAWTDRLLLDVPGPSTGLDVADSSCSPRVGTSCLLETRWSSDLAMPDFERLCALGNVSPASPVPCVTRKASLSQRGTSGLLSWVALTFPPCCLCRADKAIRDRSRVRERQRAVRSRPQHTLQDLLQYAAWRGTKATTLRRDRTFRSRSLIEGLQWFRKC